MPTEANSNSPEETFKIGEKVGRTLLGREVVLLSGELGAGKTLFTKGIAAGVGIEPGEVVSPTFTIMNVYEGKFPLFHIDLYRLGEHLKTIKSGLPEIDDNIDDGIIVIEWAQFLPDLYFNIKNSIKIELLVIEKNTRFIRIS